MTNQDTDANPRVDQWSNGTDPAAELTRMMAVRRAALGRFGENGDQAGHADGDDGRGAGPALPAPPLSGRSGGVGARRAALHLRAARRRARAHASGSRPRSSARRSRRCRRRCSPSELRVPDGRAQGAAAAARRATVRIASCSRATPGRPSTPSAPRWSRPTSTIGLILDRRARRAARRSSTHSIPALPGLDEVIGAADQGDWPCRARGFAVRGRDCLASSAVLVDRLMRLRGERRRCRTCGPWRRLRLKDLADTLPTTDGRRRTSGAGWRTAAVERDIKRFLERHPDAGRAPAGAGQPPGAPIGDLRWTSCGGWSRPATGRDAPRVRPPPAGAGRNAAAAPRRHRALRAAWPKAPSRPHG